MLREKEIDNKDQFVVKLNITEFGKRYIIPFLFIYFDGCPKTKARVNSGKLGHFVIEMTGKKLNYPELT